MKIIRSQALTPDEVKSLKKTDPSLIIETINLLLVRKYKKGWVDIYDYEILDLAKKSPDFISIEKDMSEDVVSELMKIYSEKGWKVKRVYPYDESDLDKCFRFKPKIKWFRKMNNLFVMKIVKKSENDVIILNGTAWDRSNLTVSGQVHFTHEEATRLALQEGKRLPDRFDIGQLQNLYRVEDKELHGMWFAEKKKLLKTDQSLFLPFLGYKSRYESEIIDKPNSFQFWGSGRDGSMRDNRFYFCGSKSYMTKGYISGDYQFTVRCVKDLE